MSYNPVIVFIVLIALTSLWVFPGSISQGIKSDSVAALLFRDEVQQAEALLDKQPRTAQSVALRGDLEYRKGHFDKADSLYREALRMDPKTARAHFGRGKLAVAKLNGKDAVQFLTRAIELDPAEALYQFYASKAWAIEKNYVRQRERLEEYLRLNPNDPDRLAEARDALEILKALGTKDVAVVQGPDNPAPIRFRRSLNLIFTGVMINGRGPYDFAIDTGASQTVLSERLAGQLGLTPITSTVMHGVGGGGKIDTKLYSLNEIGLGDVKIRNVPVATFNDPMVTRLADGILGTSILSDYIVTVDYLDNHLELARKRESSTAGEIIPAWFFGNIPLIPADVNGQQRGNFIVDTGAVTTVISRAMAGGLGVNDNTPGARVDLGIAGVGGFEGVVLRVPNVTFKTARSTEIFTNVVSIDLRELSKMFGTEVAGIVGCDFLQDVRVTLDYHAAEIRLSK